ncbi:response regulator transcription factor [Maribacter algarum]|uniref:Response regulator transcription factor n=1 Tax=Maribacter algarum (ex Zhang et al. 2020) TaxID=2578118 RepID=A0A5S3PVF1_9FLAO|nr:LytTR family DNA-binding domain-containing protein [Maribacter algarum]TMM56938.1 response regulator transcription factor [Maribacter algarum]
MSYTYTIIDSETSATLNLQHHLAKCGEFDCVAIAENSAEGLNAILKYTPDIVFVNLNENAGSYFQMSVELHQYTSNLPIYIGISKTKNHAYEAIKNNFFDYWLLPYDEFDVRKTIMRLTKTMPQEVQAQTICLKSYRDFHYINTNDILYLKADNNATEFIMKDGTINHAFKTLKTFEGQMPKNFIRIHQSYIVNSDYISRISYGKASCTLKYKKQQLPFSKSYRENIDTLKKLLTKNAISSLN